ncbi:major capsid protein [Paraburkholderia sp. RCC_158]|uniref:major capsid protein n=1 Tax=Paraburkholderia sp. RCC_158 TaxID=3239220 RepID=UPI0035244F15
MPLLQVEADKLSNNQLVAGVIEEIIEKDELFALLPFVGINGKAYVYDRENTLPDADFLSPNDEVNESAGTFTEVVSKLRILAGDVDVDKFLQETESDTNDQRATQIGLKAKAVGRKFKKTIAQGNATTSPKEFDGLPQLVTSAMTLDADTNGAALTLNMLDELADAVINGADAYVMRAGTIRAYRALLYATGGIQPAMVEIPNFGQAVLGHNGIPILRNDWLEAGETMGTNVNTTSVYAIRLNELDGFHGLWGGKEAGIRVEDIGTVQNKDADRLRVKWYCGSALKSTRSLARLRGITNV